MNKYEEAFERLKEYANYDNVDDFVTIKKALEKYEKALDKACECITHFQALHQGGLNNDRETTCKEWKEWLLKDD